MKKQEKELNSLLCSLRTNVIICGILIIIAVIVCSYYNLLKLPTPEELNRFP